MRRRHWCLGLLATAALAGTATAASGAPVRPARLTINLAPNPITSGDPVVIYGRLIGAHHAGQPVVLMHHLPFVPGFQPVGRTHTDNTGAYEFTRADGVVTTNRTWLVTSGALRSRSRSERVFSQVTLAGPPAGSTLLTGPANRYTFTGTVTPAVPGTAVVLQRQSSTSGGDDWHVIDRGQVAAGGHFTIVHHFVVPGDANLRVLVRGTRLNIASPSGALTYQISQAQNPALTINADANPIKAGGSVVISGAVSGFAAGRSVSLWAHGDHEKFAQVAATTTTAGGSYAFPAQSPANNTFYEVRSAKRRSAILFEGVADVLNAAVSASTVQAGQTVTFSGSVTPDKTGHVIWLQRRNANGADFHTVQRASVGAGSSYSIVHKVYDPGQKVFRVVIPGGPENEGAASAPFEVTVTPASAAALTPAQG